MKPSNNIQEDLAKNRPSMIAPIINSCFSLIFLVGLIILKVISGSPSTLIFIGLIIIIVFFPLASWYNSYISKKQKTKMLVNYEKETQLILDFVEKRKNYYAVEENDKVKIKYEYIETSELLGYSYNEEKSSLGFLDSNKCFLSIGIGFAGFEIDPLTKEVVDIKGLLPRSIWLKKKLSIPSGVKGKLLVGVTGVETRSKTYILTEKSSDTYYDSKKGYICIGDTKTYSYDEVIEIADDAKIVLRDGKFVSFYIYVGKELSLIY